ncbi:MAG: hypothetical protein DWQ10_17430 [Calditrichaeota bacterium]|nr:MAG: hypothetical protein DWQ10_17430 [Calditrichota bacterium]
MHAKSRDNLSIAFAAKHQTGSRKKQIKYFNVSHEYACISKIIFYFIRFYAQTGACIRKKFNI